MPPSARLITEIGPGRATVITYIAPVVALSLGVAVLDESVTAGTVVALLLILAGSWLSTDGRLPPGLAAVLGRPRRTQHEVRPQLRQLERRKSGLSLRAAVSPARPRP